MTSAFVPNDWPGGNGGSKKEVPQTDNKQVINRIEVWDGVTSEGWHVVFALSITWDNGLHENFGTKTTSSRVLQMGAEERISQMVVYAGQRVDRVYITTSQGQSLQVGGAGGGQHDMEVGSGYLHGFLLTSGYVIDSLRPHFYKFRSMQPSVVVTNKQVGGGGGGYFWACKADFNYKRVKRLDVWYSSVLQAIQLTWEDDSMGKWYGTPGRSGSRHENFVMDVDKGESIKEMTVRGGQRVDAIWIRTSQNRELSAGGRGGTEVIQRLGNGYLTGFEGRAGWEVDSLGPIFLSGT